MFSVGSMMWILSHSRCCCPVLQSWAAHWRSSLFQTFLSPPPFLMSDIVKSYLSSCVQSLAATWLAITLKEVEPSATHAARSWTSYFITNVWINMHHGCCYIHKSDTRIYPLQFQVQLVGFKCQGTVDSNVVYCSVVIIYCIQNRVKFNMAEVSIIWWQMHPGKILHKYRQIKNVKRKNSKNTCGTFSLYP